MRSKYYRMLRHGKKKNVAVAATARELACFVWGIMTNNRVATCRELLNQSSFQILSDKYKCGQTGKTKFLVAPLDNGHFITALGNYYSDDDTTVYSMIAMHKTKHMKASDLFSLKNYVFENELFSEPANADAILKSIYGDFIKLPPIDKRTTHYSRVEFI